MATTAFPVNPILSAIAIGYKNPDIALIADQVMPRVPPTNIDGKKFAYTKYNQADAYTVPDTQVGRKSQPNQVDFGGVQVNDECKDYGLDDVLPNDEIEAWNKMPKPAGALSPQAIATSRLTSLIMLDREIRVAGVVFNSANYTNAVTLSGGSQWSDYTNSDPLDAILTGLDACLVRPNTITLGQAAWTKLRKHPKVVQAVFGTAQSSGVVTRQQLADVLEVSRILVGAGWVNNARKGQAASMARVWGKHCSATFVSEELAMADQPTWGFTAQFGSRIAGAIPEPKMGLRGSEVIRVGESVKEVVASVDAGYFWQSCVA